MKSTNDREQLDELLKKNQIDSIFDDRLIEHLSLYTFSTGELICTQGEKAEYLYILLEGKLKIFTTSSEGRTLILSFKKPLEVIGDIEFFQGMDFINTVEAVTPVCMMGIHHQWLKKYGSDHAPLLSFFLDIITKKFSVKSNSLSFNLLHPVEVRFASYLLSVSAEDMEPAREEQRFVPIKDAANLIGTTTRHLNRVIQSFHKKGFVERKRGAILVKDKDGLAAIAGESIYE